MGPALLVPVQQDGAMAGAVPLLLTFRLKRILFPYRVRNRQRTSRKSYVGGHSRMDVEEGCAIVSVRERVEEHNGEDSNST
jgi:hypothetical protein